MPGPFPLARLSPSIDEFGISAPPFEDILASLRASYQQIFGSDTYLEPDSQDGIWLAIHAQAVHDTNQATIAAYLAYSPATAQGVGLSTNVKINGLRRLVPSNSSVELVLIGQAGREILGGVVADGFQNRWALPPRVTVPISGELVETAIAEMPGAIAAGPGQVNRIVTMQPGWQSATNPQPAFLGNPLEADATLRKRQSVSTAQPAITPVAGISGAIGNLPGVRRWAVYENDTDVRDENGLPPHSIAVVTEGGDAQQIADLIALKKSPGCGSYGTTSVDVLDQVGLPNVVNFFYLTEVPVFVTVTIQVLPGYVSNTGEMIRAAIAEALNQQGIGEDVFQARLFGPANLSGVAATSSSGQNQLTLERFSHTFIVRQITLGFAAAGQDTADLPIAFYAAAISSIDNISLELL